MPQALIIIGASGHALAVAQAATAAGSPICGFVADSPSGARVAISGSVDDIPALLVFNPQAALFVAIGDNDARMAVVSRLRRLAPAARFATVIHPSAVICEEGSVGAGAFVAAGAVTGVGSKVGDFAILNTRASLDHHSSIGAFASMAPASATGGNARIGEGCHIGMGAMVHHGVKVGDHSILGSLSLAKEDIPGGAVWVGNPARPIRQRKPGDKYL